MMPYFLVYRQYLKKRDQLENLIEILEFKRKSIAIYLYSILNYFYLLDFMHLLFLRAFFIFFFALAQHHWLSTRNFYIKKPWLFDKKTLFDSIDIQNNARIAILETLFLRGLIAT